MSQDQELLEHRIESLEHTIGGNGQPGIVQHVNELRGIAAQARILSGFAQIVPALMGLLGGFFVHFIFGDLDAHQQDIRENEKTDTRQDGELHELRFRVDELWPGHLHTSAGNGATHES